MSINFSEISLTRMGSYLLEKQLYTDMPQLMPNGYNKLLKLQFRQFSSDDRKPVFSLLNVIQSLYPAGAHWLDRRLNDVLNGKARCVLANHNNIPIGVTIETPKGTRCLKLSTVFVHPDMRDRGIGSLMLNALRDNWTHNKIERVYVTVPEQIEPNFRPLITKFGFKYISFEPHRYGPQRNEIVYQWLL